LRVFARRLVLRWIIVVLQAEREVVVVLVCVGALWYLGLVVFVLVVGATGMGGGGVGRQVRVVVRVVRLKCKWVVILCRSPRNFKRQKVSQIVAADVSLCFCQCPFVKKNCYAH
jgi:hypothetical protein